MMNVCKTFSIQKKVKMSHFFLRILVLSISLVSLNTNLLAIYAPISASIFLQKGEGMCFIKKPLSRYSYSRGLMGSEFNLVFYAANDSIAKIASDSVFKKIEALNITMSDYLDDSEINKLSATSGLEQWVKVSDNLFDVLQKSVEISTKTNGTFDVTIGPVIQVWRRAMRRKYFPSKSEIKIAKQKIGWQFIDFDTVILVRNWISNKRRENLESSVKITRPYIG
jgi:thiamine biosynthesis lipoprotein ApbE